MGDLTDSFTLLYFRLLLYILYVIRLLCNKWVVYHVIQINLTQNRDFPSSNLKLVRVKVLKSLY